jgi:hypothetical protein
VRDKKLKRVFMKDLIVHYTLFGHTHFLAEAIEKGAGNFGLAKGFKRFWDLFAFGVGYCLHPHPAVVNIGYCE